MKTLPFRLSPVAATPCERLRSVIRRWSHYLILLVLSVFLEESLAASERWETLKAINWVENPFNSPKAGPNGELGPYQFRQGTWRMYTRKPFSLALEQKHSDDVAIRHYEWIRRALLSSGIEPSPFFIALAWNAGVDKVVNGRAPASSYRYATQVTNLVADLAARTAAARAAARTPPEPEADCGGVLLTGTSTASAAWRAAWLPLPPESR